MSLFVIGDTHLSFSDKKPMNIFKGWENYEQRLEKNWKKLVNDDDTVVLAGDISWAMSLENTKADFAFINNLPGRKIILKGNHDYWWETKTKMDKFFSDNSFNTLNILHNNAYTAGPVAVCGTRGWFFDDEGAENKKVVAREAGRLRTSIEAAIKTGLSPVVFLHYPPLSQSMVCEEIVEVLHDYDIKRCYYGHLHSHACNWAVNGVVNSVDYHLISGDYLEFCPKLVEKY